MFMQKGNFIIKYDKKDEEDISKIDFERIFSEVAGFFGYKGKTVIKIYLINSVEEYCFFSNQKFERWMCAFTSINNTIFVFSPRVIEAFTSHKKEEFPGIIKHELSHLMYYHSGLSRSGIFDEGIASFLKGNTVNNNDNIYNYGNMLVRSIINDYGKARLIAFLRKTKNITKEKIASNFPSINIKKYEKYL